MTGLPHIGVCGCADCAPEASLRWALDATLPYLTQRASVEDPFETDELALATVLSLAFGEASDDAYAMLQGALQPPVSLMELDQKLDEASDRMKVIVTAAVAAKIADILTDALHHGSLDATSGVEPEARLRSRPPGTPPASFAAAPSVARVIEQTRESVAHYASKYFAEVLRPGIAARVSRVLEETAPMEVPSVAALQDAVLKAFGAQGYWRTVANAAVSRVYHYGYLKMAQLNGRRGYRWVSVVDRRTSEVCLTLNGLQFWVADAVNALERVAYTDDPEAATKLMPWRTPAEIEGASAEDLRAAGYLVPPAHPHCRSTLVAM